MMVCRLTVAVFFLWWVMKDIRFSELKRLTWKGIASGIFAAAVCVMAQVYLTALRWRMLLKGQGICISVYRAVSLTFQGSMFSLFMPGGAVGGDVLKAAFLSKETNAGQKIEGVTTIFLDRLIGMLALFLLVIAGASCCMMKILTFPPEIRFLVLILLVICLCGLLAGLAVLFQDIFFRIRFFAFLLKKADGLVHGALTRILASVEVCRKDRRTLLPAFLMSVLLLHPLLIFSAFLVMKGISGSFPGALPGILSFALGSTASVAPVTPGGLGTRDKVIEVMLQAFGVDPSVSSLTPILYSIVLMAPAFTGIVFFLLDMKIRSGNGSNVMADGKDEKL